MNCTPPHDADGVPLSPTQQLENIFFRIGKIDEEIEHRKCDLLSIDNKEMDAEAKVSVEMPATTIERLQNERISILTSKELSHLLGKVESDPYYRERQQNVNLMRHIIEHQPKTARLSKMLNRSTAHSIKAYNEALATDKIESLQIKVPLMKSAIKDFMASLSITLGSVRAAASDFMEDREGYRRKKYNSRYNALLYQYNPGLSDERLITLCDTLEEKINALLKKAETQQDERLKSRKQYDCDPDEKLALCRELITHLGFDPKHVTLDKGNAWSYWGRYDDIRIVGRFDHGDAVDAMLYTMHELGHAAYDQNLPRGENNRDMYQPVSQPQGVAMEEAQALLFQNHIGKSLPFLRSIKPIMDRHLKDKWEPEEVVKSLHVAERGAIRIYADELTYILHIIQRIRLERRMVNGELEIDDLPKAWKKEMSDLGLIGEKPLSTQGILQDAQWALGMWAYYPSYLLGSVIAAQLMEKMRGELPELDEQIEKGNMEPWKQWLKENVHHHGSSIFELEPLMKEITGKGIDIEPLLKHLERQFLGKPQTLIYGLPHVFQQKHYHPPAQQL